MENLTNYKYNLYIHEICSVCGGNQKFEVLFTSKADKCRYKLLLNHVYDMRYSIENGYIERFYQLRKNSSEGIEDNDLYVIENSEYIKFFHKQSSYTRDTDQLTNYIICDEIDTVLEFISSDEPILVKL